MSTFNNTALVTGATGFIGKRLAYRLINDGWDVKLLVRDRNRVDPFFESASQLIIGDLANQDVLAIAVHGVDFVFHCAANVKTWDTYQAYQSTNALGTANLLNSIIKQQQYLKRFIYISTMDVYGFPELPCDETAAVKTSGFGYGDTKLLAETLVRSMCSESGIPYSIIRPGNVIGPGSQFIERICQELRSGIMLTINRGQANAGLIHVDNLVDHIVWAARANIAKNQCYNARDNYDVDWNYVIQTLKNGIKGKGLVVNFSLPVAQFVTAIIENLYKVFSHSREPLLHGLIIKIFAQTCGHSAHKIIEDRISDLSPQHAIQYEEAMSQSIQWFLNEQTSKS